MINLPFSDDNLSGSRKGIVFCFSLAAIINQIQIEAIKIGKIDMNANIPVHSVKIAICATSIYLFIRLFFLIPKERFDIVMRHKHEKEKAQSETDNLVKTISSAIDGVRSDMNYKQQGVKSLQNDIAKAYEALTKAPRPADHEIKNDNIYALISRLEMEVENVKELAQTSIRKIEYSKINTEKISENLHNNAIDGTELKNISETIAAAQNKLHSLALTVDDAVRESTRDVITFLDKTRQHCADISSGTDELSSTISTLSSNRFDIDTYNERIAASANKHIRESSDWERREMLIFSNIMPSFLLPATNMILWSGQRLSLDNYLPLSCLQIALCALIAVPLAAALARHEPVGKIFHKFESQNTTQHDP